jgi:hypothetical protein
MKYIYTLVLAVIISSYSTAQVEMGGSYSLSIPLREMAGNIQPLHSLNTHMFYRLPAKLNRISFGVEMGYGIYAYTSKEQDLRFPDGSGINTTVTYSSNVASVNLQSRVNLFKQARLNPFVNGKLGYTVFFSNVTVEDPEDPLACRPLESRNIISDNTFYLAYGGGLQLDLCVFSKKQKPGKGSVDLSINKINGGNLEYINTKNIQDHMHTDPNAPAPPLQPGKGEPLNIKFVNVSTQAIHEHQVAEVYNSPLRMLDIRLGVSFRIE